jgi:hypothetical protein
MPPAALPGAKLLKKFDQNFLLRGQAKKYKLSKYYTICYNNKMHNCSKQQKRGNDEIL